VQKLLAPQESTATLVTTVVPSWNTLPLAGVEVTVGVPEQPPLAVTVNDTLVEVWPKSIIKMLEGQVMVTGLFVTVTVKLQLFVCPQLSLAVAVTMFVPTGKVLPLGGVVMRDGGGLHPPLAVTL